MEVAKILRVYYKSWKRKNIIFIKLTFWNSLIDHVLSVSHKVTRSATGENTHSTSPGAHYVHLSSQLPHRSIMVPPEKLYIIPSNGRDEVEGLRQVNTRVNCWQPPLLNVCSLRQRNIFIYFIIFIFKFFKHFYFTLNLHTLRLYFENHLILFFYYPYHSLFLTKENTFNKKHLWKIKREILFFCFSFNFPTSQEKRKKWNNVTSPRPYFRKYRITTGFGKWVGLLLFF